jgi:hypothetical protein
MSDFRFSPPQLSLLAAVLDEIIPADPGRGLPGAGSIGVGTHVETVLRQSPELQPMITEGLTALAAAAREQDSDFSALPASLRQELVGQQGFLFFLMFHGYAGYYQHPQVLTALKLEPRPPHPQGYPMQPDDWTLLDPVRRRPTLYRSQK